MAREHPDKRGSQVDRQKLQRRKPKQSLGQVIRRQEEIVQRIRDAEAAAEEGGHEQTEQ